MTPTEARELAKALRNVHRTGVAFQSAEALRSLADQVEALQKDAARWKAVEKMARKETAWDRYGDGAHWSIGVFADNSRWTFAETIDRAREAT